jgi:hypothetical protein
MATFGDPFPGPTTPAWWFATTTGTAATMWQQPIYVGTAGVAAQPLHNQPKIKPKREPTAVEWLRERVGEMCELAYA